MPIVDHLGDNAILKAAALESQNYRELINMAFNLRSVYYNYRDNYLMSPQGSYRHGTFNDVLFDLYARFDKPDFVFLDRTSKEYGQLKDFVKKAESNFKSVDVKFRDSIVLITILNALLEDGVRIEKFAYHDSESYARVFHNYRDFEFNSPDMLFVSDKSVCYNSRYNHVVKLQEFSSTEVAADMIIRLTDVAFQPRSEYSPKDEDRFKKLSSKFKFPS